MLEFLLKVFILQVISISIIVFILKKLLDKLLVDSAIRKLDGIRADLFENELDEVVIESYGPLKKSDYDHINRILFKKTRRDIRISVENNKKIRGGIIIRLKSSVIDCSLINRLKESGMLR